MVPAPTHQSIAIAQVHQTGKDQFVAFDSEPIALLGLLLSMNSFLFYNLSIGYEIFKIIKQHPNGSKTVHYLRFASRMRGLLGSGQTASHEQPWAV